MSQSHQVHVFINREKFEFDAPEQTGRTLKERAGIALTDVLFLDQPHEDDVIGNDAKVTLKNGQHFHSGPPANYGHVTVDSATVGAASVEALAQPDGWTFVIVSDYQLPKGYTPGSVRLLVKLAPTFPDAAPDMFWVSPSIVTATGGIPQGVSMETILGAAWQRFSWHLNPGAWRPGVSTLRDFMRCVRSRFEKGN